MDESIHITDRIKVVLFDHDDTLVNTLGTKFDQHKFIAKKYYGRKLSDKDIAKHYGKSLEELWRMLYDTDDVDQALAYTLKHHHEYPKILFPATIATFRKLHKSGKLIGIVTATSKLSLDYDLDALKFPLDLISYTQTADDTKYHKPDPRVFEPAKKWLADKGIKAEETLYIGDSLRDMQAALGAGFNFLGVETGLTTAAEFKKLGVKSVEGIGDVFKPA